MDEFAVPVTCEQVAAPEPTWCPTCLLTVAFSITCCITIGGHSALATASLCPECGWRQDVDVPGL